MRLTSIELCAGAGGQGLGLERAGFAHLALIEQDADCCATLRDNRPAWNVVETDLAAFDGRQFRGRVDLLAGGLPCPPFTIAGKQQGAGDERNLFGDALRLIEEIRPKAVMIENVEGFLSPRFEAYRDTLRTQFEALGYVVQWRVFDTADFNVCQSRRRVIIVALRRPYDAAFRWPARREFIPRTVGGLLFDRMRVNGWSGASAWRVRARGLAPTIVGGSRKHGGPDLGPSRSRAAWARLGVNGRSLADEAPGVDFTGDPRLTTDMVARLQGFPCNWTFCGKKTSKYRQVGNALPPQLAEAIGRRIAKALRVETDVSERRHRVVVIEAGGIPIRVFNRSRIPSSPVRTMGAG